jgi:hypothetical protein
LIAMAVMAPPSAKLTQGDARLASIMRSALLKRNCCSGPVHRTGKLPVAWRAPAETEALGALALVARTLRSVETLALLRGAKTASDLYSAIA